MNEANVDGGDDQRLTRGGGKKEVIGLITALLLRPTITSLQTETHLPRPFGLIFISATVLVGFVSAGV